jgi:hypothetical protein
MRELSLVYIKIMNDIYEKNIVLKKLIDLSMDYEEKYTEVFEIVKTLDIDTAKRFENLELGLKGLTTKERSISLGYKYLKELIIEQINAIDTLREELLNSSVNENIVNNINDIMTDELLTDTVIDERISLLTQSSTHKEYAFNSIKELLIPDAAKLSITVGEWIQLMKVLIKDYDNCIVKNDDYNSPNYIAWVESMVESITKSESLERDIVPNTEIKKYESFDTTLPSEIDKYSIENDAIPQNNLFEDFVSLLKDLSVVIVVLRDNAVKATNTTSKSLDIISKNNKDIVTNYFDGRMTKKEYNFYITNGINLQDEVYNKHTEIIMDKLNTLQAINMQANLIALLKSRLYDVIISSTVGK